jgi:hypothetical protein
MKKFLCSLLSPIIAALLMSSGWQLAAAQTAKATGVRTDALALKKQSMSTGLVPLSEISPEQLAIANRVALGRMPCELAAHVVVKPDMRGPGRFTLELGKMTYALVPVPTVTGAIRLEDKEAGVVWLQLSNKSMLMSQKEGKRLADACVSAEQLIVANELERNPAPSLLEASVRSQAVGQVGSPPVPETAVATYGAAK